MDDVLWRQYMTQVHEELGSGLNVLYVERNATAGFWFLQGARWMMAVFGLEVLYL